MSGAGRPVWERWPSKPPKNVACDAHTDADSAQWGAPVLNRCRARAVETCIDILGLEAWLCSEHAEQLEAKGRVRRNPKREEGAR